MWRYRSEAQPNMRTAAADDAGAFTAIARDYLAFVDHDRETEEVFLLYREAATS